MKGIAYTEVRAEEVEGSTVDPWLDEGFILIVNEKGRRLLHGLRHLNHRPLLVEYLDILNNWGEHNSVFLRGGEERDF